MWIFLHFCQVWLWFIILSLAAGWVVSFWQGPRRSAVNGFQADIATGGYVIPSHRDSQTNSGTTRLHCPHDNIDFTPIAENSSCYLFYAQILLNQTERKSIRPSKRGKPGGRRILNNRVLIKNVYWHEFYINRWYKNYISIIMIVHE